MVSANPPNPGEPVDRTGERTIDPTKNVLDLVRAESRFQDAMRDQESKYHSGLAAAETRRVNELTAQREMYEKRIADMLSASVQSTSSLVSTQLVQIQATFDARVSKLEQFRWESGGKSSVNDPAIADAIKVMASAVSDLKLAERQGTGRSSAFGDGWRNILAALAAGGGLVAVIELFIKH